MHSNFYTFVYSAAISIITAVVLAFSSEALKPAQEANIALEKKSNILRSVRLSLTQRAEIEKTYADKIQEMVVNSKGEAVPGVKATDIDLKRESAKPAAERQLPLYTYTGDGGKKFYVAPVYGVGLWGPVWGYVSIESDFNTVYGTYFDHKSETPGLGAEISEKAFQKQFEGKKIMSADNRFISVRVLKANEKFDDGVEHRVDGISGGTLTSRGVDNALRNCLEPYAAYFANQKNTQ